MPRRQTVRLHKSSCTGSCSPQWQLWPRPYGAWLALCPDWGRKAIAALAAALLLFHGNALVQLAAMLIGAFAGWFLRRKVRFLELAPPADLGLRIGWLLFGAFAALLLLLPVLASLDPRGPIALTNIFYRAGALVFGGGHVVLPILRDRLVPDGWISDRTFLTGYGFAQAIPGPLFTFAA